MRIISRNRPYAANKAANEQDCYMHEACVRVASNALSVLEMRGDAAADSATAAIARAPVVTCDMAKTKPHAVARRRSAIVPTDKPAAFAVTRECATGLFLTTTATPIKYHKTLIAR